MKLVRNILLIAVALLLQSTLFGRFSIVGIRPDIAMLLLILLVDGSEKVECVLYGFFIGFIQDVYSPEFLGVNAFTMSLMAFFLDIGKERLTVENYTVKAIITFMFCLAHDVIYLSFYTRFDFSMLLKQFFMVSVLGAVYTSLLMVMIMFIRNRAVNGGVAYVIQGLFGNRR